VRLVEPLARAYGTVHVPGDKSGSHRALLLSALAEGTSTIEHLSPGEDVAATAQIVADLGAHVEREGAVVAVRGPVALHPSARDLECGNSGTTMRLVAGMVAAVPGRHRLVGDPSLSRRPMDRVARPLELMGARVVGRGDRLTAPLEVTGSDRLTGIDYRLPVASAQVKSALLLAGHSAHGHTTLTEDVRTRATTETMLAACGVTLHVVDLDDGGRRVTLTPGRPQPHAWRVPGDPSQAAFFCVLGAIHDDAVVVVADVEDAPERTGFLDVLVRMGADLEVARESGRALVTVRSSALVATRVDAVEIPSVDEVPALVVAAAAASGVSEFRDVGELRVKESDRFEASRALAEALGARAWGEGDDLYVEGLGTARAFARFSLAASLDHRMVMSAAVAAAAGRGGEIEGAETVATSYPAFFEDLASLS
jgi:3-phosphoshikimate 1-carboxyvinyltransferase